MKFCSLSVNGYSIAAVLLKDDETVLPVSEINKELNLNLPETVLGLIQDTASVSKIQESESRIYKGTFEKNRDWKLENSIVEAPYLYPSKIWGVGLNYREHAKDLDTSSPTTYPASFMKPSTTIVGPRENIVLPKDSAKVTGEAELGVIIGKKSKALSSEKDAYDAIFGFVPLLDMTAEDILRMNPRFLTRAKSYDTFLSFGPFIVTKDEIANLQDLTVSTVLNGVIQKANKVQNMIFSPYFLVQFHSNIFTFNPGDILCTGTPGAVALHHGDTIECRIDDFPPLINPVV